MQLSESEHLDPAKPLASELAAEQRHVDRVYEALRQAEAEARGVEAESRARFTSDRADWLREENSTALFERDAFAYQAAKRLAILDEEHEGLVFGRLDLREDEECRYIGRIGVRDAEYEPLVIDWRAPAASAFYRATPTNPMGVVRRRVLRCRDDRVIGIEDDLLDTQAPTDLVIIGEGALMAALSRARGAHMRSIVATIQAEQDEAIRAPYQGVTMIAGGPGTGKTVVALHRAAYLLYTHRKRLERGGVLVVGPSDVFMRYIERVLPGLGEDAVALRSAGRVAQDVLGVGTDRQDDAETAVLKGSPVMARLMRRIAHEPLTAEPARGLKVAVKGEFLRLDARTLAGIRARVLGQRTMNQARPAAEEMLLDALHERRPAELADMGREEFDERVTGQASWRMFLNAWWPLVGPEQTLARLAEPSVLAKVANGLLDPDEQAVLSQSLAHARGYLPEAGQPRPAWTVSDIPLLDELYTILGPVPAAVDEGPGLFVEEDSDVAELVTVADLLTDRREDEDPLENYSHVLVDEAQDITPMQWRMIRRRGPQASWTIVGDPAQSSYPDAGQTERAMRELVGRAPHRTFRLATNYRSPAEVMTLAGAYIRRLVDDADLPNAVRSTGERPRLLSCTPEHADEEIRAQVSALAERVEGTVGVIVPPSRYDEVVALGLGDTERIFVVTALEAKGLEYDAALVVAPDEIVDEAPGGPRVLYVALTRPTQLLVTLDITPGAFPGGWREGLEAG